MLTAEARVETDRPSRYLVQLCLHFSNKGRHLGHRSRAHGEGGDAHRRPDMPADQIHVEWSDSDGTVRLPWGRCAMRVAPDALVLHAEALDEENLRRIQDLVGRHLARFSRRDPLEVTWECVEAPLGQSGEATGEASAPTGAPSAEH